MSTEIISFFLFLAVRKKAQKGTDCKKDTFFGLIFSFQKTEPVKTYCFAWARLGTFGVIFTMQLEPPKKGTLLALSHKCTHEVHLALSSRGSACIVWGAVLCACRRLMCCNLQSKCLRWCIMVLQCAMSNPTHTILPIMNPCSSDDSSSCAMGFPSPTPALVMAPQRRGGVYSPRLPCLNTGRRDEAKLRQKKVNNPTICLQ